MVLLYCSAFVKLWMGYSYKGWVFVLPLVLIFEKLKTSVTQLQARMLTQRVKESKTSFAVNMPLVTCQDCESRQQLYSLPH